MAQGEQRTSTGNIIALACGPLRKPRYINEKIEKELVEFKKEIEEKFEKMLFLNAGILLILKNFNINTFRIRKK